MGRIASPRKYDVQNLSCASSAHGNPSLFVSFRLVFQKDMISRQNVLGVHTSDGMLGKVSFIMLIPVELAVASH